MGSFAVLHRSMKGSEKSCKFLVFFLKFARFFAFSSRIFVFSVNPREVGRAWRNEAPTFEKAFDEKLSFVFPNFLKNFLESYVKAKLPWLCVGSHVPPPW